MHRIAIAIALAATVLTSSGCAFMAQVVGLQNGRDRAAYIEQHRGDRPDQILDNMEKGTFTVGMTTREAELTSELIYPYVRSSNGLETWKTNGLLVHFRDGVCTGFTRLGY